MSDDQVSRNGTTHPAELGTSAALGMDEGLQEELQRLDAINRELLSNATPQAASSPGTSEEGPRDTVYDYHDVAEDDELANLRRENVKLRAHLDSLEQALQGPEEAAVAATPGVLTSEEMLWATKQQKYEALLEEKSETIRALHLRLHVMQDGAVSLSGAAALNQMRRLKEKLEEQLAQVEKDEEELMMRMQQMAQAIAKDRAELTRQHNEIERLHQELEQQIAATSQEPGMDGRQDALERIRGEAQANRPSTELAGNKSSGLLAASREQRSGSAAGDAEAVPG
jgi:hypothetical protein